MDYSTLVYLGYYCISVVVLFTVILFIMRAPTMTKTYYKTYKEFIKDMKPMFAFLGTLLVSGIILAGPSILSKPLEPHYDFTVSTNNQALPFSTKTDDKWLERFYASAVGINNQTLLVTPKSNAPWYVSHEKKAYQIVSITYKEYKVIDAHNNKLIVIPRGEK